MLIFLSGLVMRSLIKYTAISAASSTHKHSVMSVLTIVLINIFMVSVAAIA